MSSFFSTQHSDAASATTTEDFAIVESTVGRPFDSSPGLVRWLFAGSDGARGLGQRHRARAVGSTGADISPANFSIAVNNAGDRGGDESRPMALVFRADGAEQNVF